MKHHSFFACVHTVAAMNRNGQTKVVHEAMPPMNNSGPNDVKAVAEERGYEVVEYDLHSSSSKKKDAEPTIQTSDNPNEVEQIEGVEPEVVTTQTRWNKWKKMNLKW